MPQTGHDAPAPHPRWSRFRRGIGLGMPVFLGYVPIGAAFGVIATTAGFSVLQAFACSVFVFAGAGQFVAAALLKGGAGVATILIATGVMNLRHILFGATVAPYLHETPRRLQIPIAFTLTDEVFGVSVTDLQAGTANDYSMIGTGVTAWSGWVLGSSIGAGAATLIGDPTKWGVEFAMPAMFTALLVAQLTSRRRGIAACVSALACLGLSLVLPGAWPPIAGAMVAATVMAVSDR
jgi:4-azaleucine resistance transporter AzlC